MFFIAAFNASIQNARILFSLKISAITDDFAIECDACKFRHVAGETTLVYDYTLLRSAQQHRNRERQAQILHDDYVDEAKGYKYCIIRSTLKPLELFDKHNARKTGRQRAVQSLQAAHNSIKKSDAPRGSASGSEPKSGGSIPNSPTARASTSARSTRNLKANASSAGLNWTPTAKRGKGELQRKLHHTLPVKFLWTLTTDNATLLCKAHNAAKAEKWPGAYYEDAERVAFAACRHRLSNPER